MVHHHSPAFKLLSGWRVGWAWVSGCSRVPHSPPASPGRMPLSAEPAKVTPARINLVNKTVHQGGHYLLIRDDRADRRTQWLPGRLQPLWAQEHWALGRAGAQQLPPASLLLKAGDTLPTAHNSLRGTASGSPPALPCPALLASLPAELASGGLCSKRAGGEVKDSGPGGSLSFTPGVSHGPRSTLGAMLLPLGTRSWSRWPRAGMVGDPCNKLPSTGGAQACPVCAGGGRLSSLDKGAVPMWSCRDKGPSQVAAADLTGAGS